MTTLTDLAPPSQPAPVGILLAGGFSRRFAPHNKLLHALEDGRPMAIRAAQTLIEALPQSVAVVRAPAEGLVVPLAAMGFQVVACQAQHQLMSDSLKLGIRTATERFASLTGVVITLADMPFIQVQTIAQVAHTLIQARIVQPCYQHQGGHPVGFCRDLIAELLQVEGDQGARAILKKHAAQVLRLECQDAGILRDIDTPADLD